MKTETEKHYLKGMSLKKTFELLSLLSDIIIWINILNCHGSYLIDSNRSIEIYKHL